MPRVEEIAKKLNSVGLDANDAFRDVLTDYFGENAESDSESDSDSPICTEHTDKATGPQPCDKANSIVPDRPMFGISCGDDDGSLQVPDAVEEQLINEFMQKSCCHLKCTDKFNKELVASNRQNAKELNFYSHTEHINFLHTSLLGSLNCCVATGDETNLSKNKNTPRMKDRGHFYFQGKPICKQFFLFLHAVSDKVYRSLKSTLAEEGIVPKAHQNTVKIPAVRAHSLETRQQAVRFLENFAIQHAVVLPGRVPGFKNPDLLILPSEYTKTRVHQKYAACVPKEHLLPYSTFTELWKELMPHICIQKPRSDLCSTCKMDTLALSKLRSLDDEKRRALLDRNLHHLNLVDSERAFYRSQIEHAKTSVSSLSQQSIPPAYAPTPCSFSGCNHYSFDYFQQVHIPSDPDQVGALYFLVPYKVGLFGIMCEALSKMVLFVIPEGAVTGKGSNQVISMLHYYFTNFSLGESDAFLNADNCVGQNKNQFVISYLCWRVMSGLNKKIILHFLVVGHTKFSPDYGAGVFKKIFRRTPCATPDDVANCAKQSHILHPVITGSVDGKHQLVPMYDWQSKFAVFKPIPNLKKYHVFEFSDENPGVVTCREHSGSDPVSFAIISGSYDDDSLPPILPSLGLSHKRQQYLFQMIRPFVPDSQKDLICPQPASSVTDGSDELVALCSTDVSAEVATELSTSAVQQPSTSAAGLSLMDIEDTQPTPAVPNATVPRQLTIAGIILCVSVAEFCFGKISNNVCINLTGSIIYNCVLLDFFSLILTTALSTLFVA